MRTTAGHAYWLLAMMLLLPGCHKKVKPAPAQTQVIAPVIVDAPPPKPATVSKADLPPPVVGDVTAPDTSSKSAPSQPDTQKKPVRRTKKPPVTAGSSGAAEKETTTATAAAPAQATPSAPPSNSGSVPAIGTLSGGASGDARSQTDELIASTEHGVNNIGRSLSGSESKTALQIHDFLKQAKEALLSGDVDGANTLARKAKVLLTELTQ